MYSSAFRVRILEATATQLLTKDGTYIGAEYKLKGETEVKILFRLLTLRLVSDSRFFFFFLSDQTSLCWIDFCL